MAQSPPYPQLRFSGFYFRLRVPDSLRPVLQRREWVVSLRTVNRCQALRLSYRLMTDALKPEPHQTMQWLRGMIETALKCKDQERLRQSRRTLDALEEEYDMHDLGTDAFANRSAARQTGPVARPCQ